MEEGEGRVCPGHETWVGLISPPGPRVGHMTQTFLKAPCAQAMESGWAVSMDLPMRGFPGNFCWAGGWDRGLCHGSLFATLQEGLLRERPAPEVLPGNLDPPLPETC